MMGPKGSRDQGFLRSAIDNFMVEEDLLEETRPVVRLRVWVVIGVCIVQLRDVKSVPCSPVQIRKDVASFPVVPYQIGI